MVEKIHAAVAVDITSGLTLGRHYILIHGQSDAGDWGPFTAVFLSVGDAGDLDFDADVDLDDDLDVDVADFALFQSIVGE